MRCGDTDAGVRVTVVAGIDPGITGGVAFLSTDGECEVFDMPALQLKRREVDPHGLALLFWKRHAGHVFIEQQWCRPNDSGPGGFAVGKGFGIILGVLAACGIPYTIVSPQKWKKALNVPASKDGARARAGQLLPNAAHNWQRVKDDGKAESALIALYGIQSFDGIATGKVAA